MSENININIIYSNFEDAEKALQEAPYCAYAALCAALLAPNQATRSRMNAYVEINRSPVPSTQQISDEVVNEPAHIPDAPEDDGQENAPHAECAAIGEPENPSLTESFARILIKNQNYSKALAIIQDLNLKNPEKSIYFADQIRFLKKLILNQAKK